jgi:hypothetical protein
MKRRGSAVVLLVLLAGCASPAPTTSPIAGGNLTRSAGTAAGVPSASSDPQARLEKIVIQAAELTTDWKGQPYQAGANDDAIQAEWLTCVGLSGGAHSVASAHSDDYALGGTSVSSSATAFRSQSDIDADVAVLRSPKASPCYEQQVKTVLATSMPAGYVLKSLSFTITMGSAGGPDNVVATSNGTIALTAKATGKQVLVYETTAFITGPLTEADVQTSNVGAPLPASDVRLLVAAVALRAANG